MNRPADLINSTSRRRFMKYASLFAAAPIMGEAQFAHAARLASSGTSGAFRLGPTAFPEDAVLINANENPMGPSQSACEAIAAIAPKGGRYDLYGETDKLTRTFAQQHGLKEDHVTVYAGSSEPLHYTVLAFTSPSRGFVTADPSYEAGMYAARVSGALIFKVHLTPEYAHDVKALVAADPNAGVIYICNPNNPTGTITAKKDILWALDNKPAGSILLVDEAYIHLSDAEDVLDQVAAGKDLIVLRTFSKVYGMAGLRCGFALGRPDLLQKLQRYGQNAMVVTGANNYKVIGEPQTNCFMIDTGRSGKSVIAAMQAKNVYIGRTWPVWPNAVRITVGSPTDMARFKVAFKEVMDAPPAPVDAAAPVPDLAGPHPAEGLLADPVR